MGHKHGRKRVLSDEERKERKRASDARYYSKNKETIIHRTGEWAKKNRDKRNKANKAYIERDPARHKKLKKAAREKPEIIAKEVAWVKTNRGKVNGYKKKYNEANPALRKAIKANRRARELNANGRISSDLAEKLFKFQKGKCACCGRALGNSPHLDHIVALSRGGANEDRNIQLLRGQCNQEKHAKDPIDFMQSRGFLL